MSLRFPFRIPALLVALACAGSALLAASALWTTRALAAQDLSQAPTGVETPADVQAPAGPAAPALENDPPDDDADELLFDPDAPAQAMPDTDGMADLDESFPYPETFTLAQAGGQAGQGGQAPLNGFADAPWGSTYTEVRTRLKNLATSTTAIERVEILNEVPGEFILVRRNDVLYRYNFYRTPYNVALLQNHNLTTEEHEQLEGRLFHVKVSMPFVLSELVKEKLTVIYGLNARSTVDDKKFGADIWEPAGGLIFQWYEPYRGKAFTRTVDYLSLDLAKEIMTEYADYFDAREKLLLQKILLQ